MNFWNLYQEPNPYNYFDNALIAPKLGSILSIIGKSWILNWIPILYIIWKIWLGWLFIFLF